MDTLMESLNSLCDGIGNQLARIQHFKRKLREAGIKANNSECEDILDRAVAEFKVKFHEKSRDLCADTGVEEKLDEMKALIEESEKENEDVGAQEGYRPQDPSDDVIAHLKIVQQVYKESIVEITGTADEEMNRKKAELREKKATLQALKNELFTVMNG